MEIPPVLITTTKQHYNPEVSQLNLPIPQPLKCKELNEGFEE